MRTLALLLLPAALAAADGVDDIFRVWDANGDGRLTRDELPDAATFDKVDGNRDGTILREEVAAFLGVKPAGPKEATREPAKPADPAPKPPEKKSEAAPKKDPRPGSKEERSDFFERFDADKDGRISATEFRGGEEVFRQYDRNRDGFLSPKEVERYLDDRLKQARRNPRPDNFMEIFDGNRDGKVTRREYDGPSPFFRSYDHDGDDVVTEAELNMGPVVPKSMMAEGPAADPDGPTPLPRRTLLDRYDKDADGKVTLEELGGAESVMQRLDRNGDGILSGGEVR